MHEPLEERWRIGEPKVHYLWQVCPVTHFKGSLPLVFLYYPDVVVPPSDVKLGETPLSSEILQEFSDVWKRVVVMDSPFV